jgi:hypothetical protein
MNGDDLEYAGFGLIEPFLHSSRHLDHSYSDCLALVLHSCICGPSRMLLTTPS